MSLAKKLFTGIGQSKIQEAEISITNYPFEPSVAYPHKTIKANEINSISIDFGPCELNIGKDIVFVSAEKKDELEKFAKNNRIIISPHSFNWEWLLEPYLDTTFTPEHQELVLRRLKENGLEKTEVYQIRQEIQKQMYSYNFDTMLWEWCSLGLLDVLSAMRENYDRPKFRDFYYRAMEIQYRGINNFNNT